MEMFLMMICLSLFGVAILSLAFAAATRPERPNANSVQPEAPPLRVSSPRFFAQTGDAARPPGAPQIPIEALLLQIEDHVRLEHAAAESFVEAPTSDLLHAKTISPLVQ